MLKRQVHKPVSASKLKEFKSCPHKMFRTRILKDVSSPESPAMNRGTVIHKTFETFFKTSLWAPDFVQPDMEVLTYKYGGNPEGKTITLANTSFAADSVFAEAFALPYPRLTYFNDGVKASLILRALQMKTWNEDPFEFLKEQRDSSQYLLDNLNGWYILPETVIKIMQNRQVIEANRYNRYTNYHWADATPDLLALRGSKAIIIDFKTGEWKPAYAKDNLDQVTFYAALTMDKFPQCQECVAIVYHPVGGKQGMSSVTVSRNSPEHLNIYENIQMVRHALEVYEATGATEQFYKNKSGLCGYCPVTDCEFKTVPKK